MHFESNFVSAPRALTRRAVCQRTEACCGTSPFRRFAEPFKFLRRRRSPQVVAQCSHDESNHCWYAHVHAHALVPGCGVPRGGDAKGGIQEPVSNDVASLSSQAKNVKACANPIFLMRGFLACVRELDPRHGRHVAVLLTLLARVAARGDGKLAAAAAGAETRRHGSKFRGSCPLSSALTFPGLLLQTRHRGD